MMRTLVSPYRICPVGAHIDHQGGRMLATAIDVGTRLEFEAADRLDLGSRNFDGRVRFDPRSAGSTLAPSGIPDWGRYAWAAFAVLRDRLPEAPRGFRGEISGQLPGSGLSSSASVLLAYLNAWADVNDVVLSPRDQVLLAVAAENDHVGVACGVLDPAAIVGSRRGELLMIDSESVTWEGTALPDGARAPRFLAIFTGRERNLAQTDFNRRVGECRSAARAAAERLGARNVTRLGDLDREALRSVLGEIPDPLRLRARHFVEESDRVEAAQQAWAQGRFDRVGQMMSDSCRSSVVNYETGSEEQRALQSIWESTPGVLGARFSGAGYGGCSIALLDAKLGDDENAAAEVAERVLRAFRSAVPSLADRARAIAIESADGLAIR